MLTSRLLAGAVGVAMGAGAALGQMTDPNLDPNYDPAAAGGQGASAATQQGAQPGVHPATVLGVGKPTDKTLVAPPPGWQLARPMFLNGRLYYAVHDADAYLAQAGWTRAAAVYKKEDTGLRFDLIRVPAFRTGSAVRRYSVGGTGTSLSLDNSGSGYGWHQGWAWDWAYDPIFNTGGYAGPIDGQLSPGYQPPVEPAPEPVVLTTVEQAEVELAFGDPERAVDLYRAHLADNPGDMESVRALGIALLKAGRFEDAAATVRLAYATDPLLAADPVGSWIGGDSPLAVRHLRVDAARHANRVNTASAWLMVVVLMQGEGLDDPAIKLLDRAGELGLEPAVVSAMRRELTKR